MNDSATVTRSGKTARSRFARIDNAALQDDGLSFRARGVLAYILSRPDTWIHSAERLASSAKEGVDSIRAALRELETRGYAELRRVRSIRGSVVHRWYFHESPNAKMPEALPQIKPRVIKDTVKKPSDEKGGGEKAHGKRAMLETTNSETTERETTGGKNEGAPSILIPWRTLSDLPNELREQLARLFPSEAEQAEVIANILGRKLRFRDEQPDEAAWIAVVRSEIADAASKRRTNSRSFANAQDYSGVLEKLNGSITGRAGAADIPEPHGWQAILDRMNPDSPHATGGWMFGPWDSKDRSTRDAIAKLVCEAQQETAV